MGSRNVILWVNVDDLGLSLPRNTSREIGVVIRQGSNSNVT